VKHPRYEVHSVTGYSASQASGGASGGKLSTTYVVLDAWNCYRETPLLMWGGSGTMVSQLSTAQRRGAERNCERLNREHDEWLAA
jgi:hypothetical protein